MEQRRNDDSQQPQLQQQQQARLLLVWPTNTSAMTSQRTTNPRQGLCIGWKTAPSSNWPITTIVVAGILPSDTPKQSSLQKHLQDVARRLQQMQLQCCYCCTCSHSGCSRSVSTQSWTTMACNGCTRRLCFEELTVVASLLVDKIGDDLSQQRGNTRGRLNNLPRISLSPDGLPRFQGDKGAGYNSIQVLLYGGSDRVALFRHISSLHESPFFSKSLLTRMTHASKVVAMLHASSATSTKIATNNDTTKVPSLASSTFQRDTERTASPEANAFPPLDLLQKHSLFFRHFFARRQEQTRLLIPLADLARRIYVSWKSREFAGSEHPSCPNCRQGLQIQQSLYESTSKATAESDAWTLVAIDAILGIVLGVALFQRFHHQSDWKDLIITAIRSHHRLLSNGIQWLERFPIGLKLNQSLTQNVGREIQRWWHLYEWTLLRLLADSRYLVSLLVISFALVSCLFGASGLTALCFDSTRLLSLHISTISYCTQKVYSFELYLLASLWRLFRGKKRNILRHRTDTMQYDSMQSLLGTILFAVALFLFTTILVYQAFFAFLYLSMAMITIALGVLYSLLHCFPLGSLSRRFRRPELFTREVFLEELLLNPDTYYGSDYCACRVAIRPVAYSTIILDHTSLFLQSSLSWCLSFAAGSLSGRCAHSTITSTTHNV